MCLISVPCQVIRSQTLTRNVVSVCTKVILQMNCKLGGSLWKVHVPVSFVFLVFCIVNCKVAFVSDEDGDGDRIRRLSRFGQQREIGGGGCVQYES